VLAGEGRGPDALAPAPGRAAPGARPASPRADLRVGIDRALRMTSPDRILAVAPAAGDAGGTHADSGITFLAEPRDRGSAASVLLALAHVLEREEGGMIVVLW